MAVKNFVVLSFHQNLLVYSTILQLVVAEIYLYMYCDFPSEKTFTSYLFQAHHSPLPQRIRKWKP